MEWAERVDGELFVKCIGVAELVLREEKYQRAVGARHHVPAAAPR
jgi:hypothetical protein